MLAEQEENRKKERELAEAELEKVRRSLEQAQGEVAILNVVI